MDFEAAKTALQKGYEKAGFEVKDAGKLLHLSSRGQEFHVVEEDIIEYAAHSAEWASYKSAPTETSMCSPQRREQLVNYVDPMRIRFRPGLREDVVFGDAENDQAHVVIGRATSRYLNYFRFDPGLSQILYDRYVVGRVGRFYIDDEEEGDARDIRKYLPSLWTIRAEKLGQSSIEGAVAQSTPLLETCLFQLSYLKGIAMSVAEEWPRRQPRTRPFVFGETPAGPRFQMPRATFNADVIRLYQRGMGTDDPVLKFLSFYQVLEYFFVIVSDEELYSQLARRLSDPRFALDAKHLDRLIHDVESHKRDGDETELLKKVLKKFVDETELIEFIKAFEAHANEQIFTSKRKLFGQELRVELAIGHVIGHVARRIKTIRNALVHSSDRYEREARYLPFTNNSETLVSAEVPLVKYLAERVIVGSSVTRKG